MDSHGLGSVHRQALEMLRTVRIDGAAVDD